jgi:hypothetical protein
MVSFSTNDDIWRQQLYFTYLENGNLGSVKGDMRMNALGHTGTWYVIWERKKR